MGQACGGAGAFGVGGSVRGVEGLQVGDGGERVGGVEWNGEVDEAEIGGLFFFFFFLLWWWLD